MMGGAADGGQTAGQEAPVDLVSVPDAAQAVGVTDSTVQSWIRRGRLTAYTQPFPQGRRVSLTAVRALSAPRDPQAPPEAVLVAVAARAVGLLRGRIRVWARQGLLPSWQSHRGLLVRPDDVRALAQKRGVLPPDAEAEGVAPCR